MSFIGIVEADLDEAGQVALAAAKTTVAYIDNVIVQDVEPILLKNFLAAIEQLGAEAVAALLGNATTSSGNATSSAPTPPTGT